MGKIKVLTEDIISKICAGEIVENPASVVKELLENSIDANSNKISISTLEGGKKLISISDNGCGMDEEDIQLCVERFTTSKLEDANSIYSILTLGFRGEALSSIASISKMSITSRTLDMPLAACLKIEGGKKSKISYVSREPGTTIDVEYLFFNTPARQKFLKSPISEFRRIYDIVEKYVLFYKTVSFSFYNEEKCIIKCQSTNDSLERINDIYGEEISKHLLPVEFSHRRFVLNGFVSAPNKTFSDRRYQMFFVNGRYVRNNTLFHALELECKNYLPSNQFPFAFLMLNIDPTEIDINVHPTKKEIKFRNDNEIYQYLRVAVREAFEGNKLKIINESQHIFKKETEILHQQKSQNEPIKFSKESHTISQQSQLIPFNKSVNYKILGQSLNTYLIVELNNEILIIDQHAASERIIFNELKNNGDLKRISQKTLFYEPVELPLKEFEILIEKKQLLYSCGIEIQEFGGRSIIIKALPYSVKNIDPLTFLIELANEIKDLEKESREKVWKVVACHFSIRAGDKLEYPEIKFLIDKLFSQTYYLTCPHGRPIYTKFSIEDLEKLFKRT